MKIEPERIRRLHFGYIVAPEGSDNAGQPIPVCGYLIEHPKGRILFDTGISRSTTRPASGICRA